MTPDASLLAASLDDAIAPGRVPGVSAAVVADGAVQWVGASGVADVPTGADLAPASSFLWFSMTKIVTATAAMRLVDDGRLALDDPVDTLVPDVLTVRGSDAVRVNGASYGGLVGPVADAARVALMHANGGEIDGARVLSAEAVREMHTISSTGKPFDHGLGWFRPPAARDRQPMFVEHYGGGGGYHNLMRLYPQQGVGTVVMGNSTSYDVDAVTDALAAPWLG